MSRARTEKGIPVSKKRAKGSGVDGQGRERYDMGRQLSLFEPESEVKETIKQEAILCQPVAEDIKPEVTQTIKGRVARSADCDTSSKEILVDQFLDQVARIVAKGKAKKN